MKENQNLEFWVIHVLHLTKPLYIVEVQEKQEFWAFPAQKPWIQYTPGWIKNLYPEIQEIQTHTTLYILDTSIQWIHTCVTRNTWNLYPIYANYLPSAHLNTTQEDFSQSNCSYKNLNQFEPVLASAEFTKKLQISDI